MKRQTTTDVGTENFYLITLIFINTTIFSSCTEFHRECIITEPNWGWYGEGGREEGSGWGACDFFLKYLINLIKKKKNIHLWSVCHYKQ